MVYFLREMLRSRGDGLKGKTCLVSGSGNVALYTVEKILQLGGKAVTLSDSSGFIYDPDGVSEEKLDYVIDLKTVTRGRISEYAEKFGCEYHDGKKPWGREGGCCLPLRDTKRNRRKRCRRSRQKRRPRCGGGVQHADNPGRGRGLPCGQDVARA